MTNNDFGKLLDKKLVGVATKKDLKELAAKKDLGVVKKDVGVLKKDVGGLKKDLKDFEGRFEFKLVQMEQRFNDKLEKTFSEYTKKMLDKFDEVIGELRIIREEKVFQQAQIERLTERVERIEQHIGLQPHLS